MKATGFAAERYTSSLVSVYFFLLLWLLALKLVRSNENLLLVSTILFFLITTELLLFKFSPHKTFNEKVYGFLYQSEFYVESMSHFKESNHEYTYATQEFVNKFVSNSTGLRDDEVHKDSISVFIIGDSFIEGYGVDNANTIDKNLEKLMQCNQCVLNVGCKGSDMEVGFQALSDLLSNGYLPGLVILNVNTTDFYDYNKHFVSSVIPSKTLEFFYGSSFIFRHIFHLIYDVDYLMLTPEKREIYNNEVFELMKKTFVSYKNLLSENNIDFFVFFQPLYHELSMSESDFTVFYNFLESENIHFFDTFNELKNYPNNQDLYWPIDGHFNNEGVMFYSELIFKVLQNKMMLHFITDAVEPDHENIGQ